MGCCAAKELVPEDGTMYWRMEDTRAILHKTDLVSRPSPEINFANCPELREYSPVDPRVAKNCMYFLRLLDTPRRSARAGLFKFGIAKNIRQRLTQHKTNKVYGAFAVVRIVVCGESCMNIETEIGALAATRGERTKRGKHDELIATDNIWFYIQRAQELADEYIALTSKQSRPVPAPME